MNILLTGGAGYVGSHAAVVLSEAGHEVVLLDNFCNSNKSVLERIRKILGKSVPCIEADVRDTGIVEWVLREYKISAVIHFAGLKRWVSLWLTLFRITQTMFKDLSIWCRPCKR